MIQTSAGQIIVNYVLPKELRDYTRVLDKKGIQQLFDEIARKYPDRYGQIVYDLSKIGYMSAFFNGGYSAGIKDYKISDITEKYRNQIIKKVYEIYSDSSLEQKQKQEKIVSFLAELLPKFEDELYEYNLKIGNPLAYQVASGSRGNKNQLKSLIGFDGLYVDHKERAIPVPVIHGYSEGLSPVEFFSGGFGARKGLIDTKFCLSGDTLVLKADLTEVPIIELQPGDEIFAFSLKKLQPEKTKIQYVYNNGRRLCFRFEFYKTGVDEIKHLHATKDHLILCKSEKGFWEKRCVGTINPNWEIGFVDLQTGEIDPGWRIKNSFEIGHRLTFDLQVDHPDHLFILKNGLIVENSVQDAGFFSKQLNQISHQLVVVAKDADEKENAYLKLRGLPVDIDDPDNVGAALSYPVGNYPRNTILTPQIIADLKEKGIKKIVIRSPIASYTVNGGLYAMDVGVREKGQIPPVGDFVGIAAAQALSEPLAQAQLNSKHTAGVAGQGKGVTGFKLINQLVQVPKIFKSGATHSQVDGTVKNIRPAPQGGFYVYVNNIEHYVPHNLNLKVKIGDEVEAGDVLSEGLPNPSEIVKHKGIGEGRRYFMKSFYDAYKDSGMSINRRNVEIVSSGLINHIKLNQNWKNYIVEDIIPYNILESNYTPRPDTKTVKVKNAIGKYLERPVLHYTIGTKIRPSVAKTLEEYGIDMVDAHDEPPFFEPVMIRGMENLSYDPNWLTRFLGSYLKKNLLHAVHRSESANLNTTSFIPSLAEAKEFGLKGPVKGWKIEDVKTLPPPIKLHSGEYPSVLKEIEEEENSKKKKKTNSILDFDDDQENLYEQFN